MRNNMNLSKLIPKLIGSCLLFFLTTATAQHSEKKWALLSSENGPGELADLFSDPAYFKLEKNNEMHAYRSYTDELGNKHERYFQSHKGYRVEEGHYILHFSSKGALKSMNGTIIEGLELEVSTIIPEDAAIQAILADFGQKGIEITQYEIKKPSGYIENNKDQVLKGSLVIARPDQKSEGKEYSLCYKFKLLLTDSRDSYTCYVNAVSGVVLKVRSNARGCSIGSATGTTKYNGTQSFTTEKPGVNYKLIDDCRKIHTYDYYGSHPREYKDSDDNWTDSEDREGVSVHWALQRTFDFYEFAYNLTGVDGAYQEIEGYAEWNLAGKSAQWDGNEIKVKAESDTNNSYATLDILAHEWTHGVDEYSANLEYINESGALDESFADIFGSAVKYYVQGMTAGTYLQGYDRGASRSLQDPSAAPYYDPSIYEGTYWYTGVDDNGGVHTNSGVQNYWFYLLAEGGSQTVDGVTYTVTGIGIENAAYVAYKNRRDYLSTYSQYKDSKNGSILAAIDIWGTCDWKVEQVVNAWNAVGVSSVGGIHYDESVNCTFLGLAYDWFDSYEHVVIHNLTSGCTYPAGETTDLLAGNEIRFQPGSIIHGGDFRAHITPCLENNMKKKPSPYPVNYGGLGNTAVEIDQNESMADLSPLSDVHIYPNPSSDGIFTVEIRNDDGASQIEVTDVMGKTVFSANSAASLKTKVNLTNLSKGLYFVKITNGDQVRIEKLMYR